MRTRASLFALILVASAACGDDGSNNATCGDGDVGAGEQCDDGNASNGDGCSSACKTEGPMRCGNNEVDVATETCDDGNTTNGDGCSSMCQNECGNGMLDGAEQCDDGNLVSADGCSTMCFTEPGFTCTGEPSDCIKPTGACADPFLLPLAPNGSALTGMGTGDTTMSMDQVMEADCDGFPSGAGKDHVWQFTLSATKDVTIEIDSITSFDALLRVLSVPCDPTSEVKELVTEDGCSDGFGPEEKLTYTALPAGTYYVVIDAYDDTEFGTYTFRATATDSACGNGTITAAEVCDDGNTTNNDGCSATCDVEAGYACTGMPSVCGSACGNGGLETGEECDDDNTTGGDRCSPTCTLEFDVAEVEPNNTVAQVQVLTATDQIVRGALTSNDNDLYSFTLTAPATVEIEIYNSIDPMDDYEGVGMIPNLDCTGSIDTELFLFAATGDPLMETTALFGDDEDGDESCSYLGLHDDDGNMMEGVLAAGTYTIRVNSYFAASSTPYYAMDIKISQGPGAVPPVPGDLVLNEFMAGDNMSDTNCDGATIGTNDEFVELVNVSSKVLDITGLTIADSVTLRHTFAAGPTGSMTLDPGKAVVVWTGGAPACAGVTNWFVASTGQLGLNDAGDTITVADAAMVQLIQNVYPAATLNVSSNRSPDVVGTVYALHNSLTGAVGAFSPGKRANGTAF